MLQIENIDIIVAYDIDSDIVATANYTLDGGIVVSGVAIRKTDSPIHFIVELPEDVLYPKDTMVYIIQYIIDEYIKVRQSLYAEGIKRRKKEKDMSKANKNF